MKVNLNSITNSKQVTNITDRQKDKIKDKENMKPIMPYYIINNRLYSSHYNSPKNHKSFLHKKKPTMNNINNPKDININIKNTSKNNIIKTNSSISSYYHFNYNYSHLSKKVYKNEMKLNSLDYSPSIKDKILSHSKNNLKNNTLKISNKNFNFDYNLLMKRINNPYKQKSSHDIFYNENKNCYTLNSNETKKKNKQMIMTSLNTSKNSSHDKTKITSKKRFYKFNYNKHCSQENNINNKLLLNDSSKYVRIKNSSSNNIYIHNSNKKNAKIYKKNHTKFLNNELFNPDKKRHGINFFINYVKGANNVASNNNNYKSISINSTGNISYKKPKITVYEGKNDISKKDYYNSILSKPTSKKKIINSNSSIKSKKFIHKINTRSLSINSKNEKIEKINVNKGFSNLYSLDIKKNTLNNSKINLKKLLCQNQIDSPFYKYCHKTTGNYFNSNNNTTTNNSIIKTSDNKNNFNNFNFYKTIKSQNDEKYIIKNNCIINTNNNDKKIKAREIINKNIENDYNIKINKVIKDSLQEISKIRNNFAKHFTSNNSPNQKNEIISKRELDANSICTNNLYLSKKDNYKYNSNKNIFQNKKFLLKKSSDKKDKNFKNKIKFTPKENALKIKPQKIKHLTQNNSKINIKKIKVIKGIREIKKENPTIQIKNIPNRNDYKPILTHSSLSYIHDSLYYMKESQKLSEYIKNYYMENKQYPETNLNFYKYGRLIGQGAFGKVNLGLNILTGRVVAIKSFNKLNLTNSDNMKKILYETNLMKKLNHPNVTKILELFEEKEYILIIMEYINGGNLFSFLKKRRKVSEKTAKFLFKQIILGIKYIHSHNIVHRDIKLENILIDLNNNIKICDFGIGRVLSSPDQLLYDQCGTPMYIAPEILLSTKKKGYKGFPVDIWSSGIALYILLSGSLPFSFKNGTSVSIEDSDKKNENNEEELQFSIVNNEPKNIENISDEAKNLLRGLLNKNPEKRLTCDQILAHPWLQDVNENIDNNKYHLFTKAEMKMLSKTYVDYRKDKHDNLKEIFTLSNLFCDRNDNKNNEKNIETKSSILAPFNSVIKDDDEEEEDEYNFNNNNLFDDLTNDKIHLENGIIVVGHKVEEFNMLYEMNNNCEVDNGIIINSKTNTLTSESNNTINSGINSTNKKNDSISKTEKIKTKVKNSKTSSTKAKKIIKEIKNNDKNNDNIKRINNILNQLECMGYDKNYVKECVKNNILCHASTAYFLMLNYDKI